MLNEGGGPPAHAERWRLRWHEVLNDGFRRDADVSWFTGEQGLLLVCHDLARHDLEALASDPDFEALLDELDDRLIAFPGPMPSDRARALLDVALSVDAAEVSPRARQALAPAGADLHDEATRRQVDGIVTDLRLWFGAGGRTEGRRQQEAPIVVSHHARGDVVLLTVRDHPVLGVAPDMVRAPFQRIDEAFARSIERAMTAARVTGGVRYLVRSRRTGSPLDAIGGRSAGLGAALALRRLSDPLAAPLDPEWSFTGAVDTDGSVTTLCGTDGSSEYGAKLSSLDRGALVYPAVDRIDVERLGDVRAPGTRLESVATVAEAERLVARHIEGRRAYERAVDPGRQVSKLTLAGFAALTVVLLWLWLSHYRHAAAAAEARRSEAAGEVIRIDQRDPDHGPGGYLINRSEVTNGQYRLCADTAGCRWPDPERETTTIRDEVNSPMPVTGVSVADAATFCEWAHGDRWSVPVFSPSSASLQSDPQNSSGQFWAASGPAPGSGSPVSGFRCASPV